MSDMLSRPPISKIIALETMMHKKLFSHDAYKEEY